MNSFILLTQFADFIEDGNAQTEGNEIVSPDPLLLDIMLQRELGDFCTECIWILHWASNFLNSFIRHSECTVNINL